MTIGLVSGEEHIPGDSHMIQLLSSIVNVRFCTIFGKALLPLLVCLPVAAAETDARIQPWTGNPYYWAYQGKPVLLLGGSSEDNLFQVPDVADQLAKLVEAGGNYVRCTMSWRDDGNVMQFKKKGDRYDLNEWNPEFWNRFERFLQETAKHEIIVQIEVWATFDYYQSRWDRNP
ncbi:MAG: hypothetical protein U9N87_13330, partial [Planctomycetota bacterium]|nr:hypothetical protein [Planctomycetota bacterium]